MIQIGKEESRLLKEASRAMEKAHVLWGFKVGAAVLAEDGKIYGGCNVESWVSGLGVCAERCAIQHAVVHGNRKIKEIAVVTDVKTESETKPCGACLQYIF
ncbi:MAG: cytidine deaminase [Candidatus Bathyarchaeales archaeon]